MSSVDAAEVPTVDWPALAAQLSRPDLVQATDANLWLDQCIKPFDAATLNPIYLELGGVSNYDLFEQSSGLCMQTAACSFANCRGIFPDVYGPFQPGGAFYQSAESELYNATFGPGVYPVLSDEELLDAATREDGAGELPAAVVHPLHAGDVSAAVKFAASNGLEVAVKTSGHNWMGSSTRRDALLLNLSKLRKYALPESPAEGIFLCGDGQDVAAVSPSVAAACKLAVARGKPAVMRAGGGQIVDEGQRAVEAWNGVEGNVPLHAMTGSAGTVGLAGGWLASGGLGGSVGMREFGVGVDQVLHVEMVLPDGRFVRFGPSDWTSPEGDQLNPQTTEVKGYCMADDGADLSDESNWTWIDCSDEYNFADLWYAIRGGGGGSWGVVTSAFYQLNDKPGTLQTVHWYEPIAPALFDPAIADEDEYALVSEMLKFVFAFLYKPETIGVSAEASNSCSAPDQGPLACYNGAGQVFADAWEGYFDGKVPSIRVEEHSSYVAEGTAEGRSRIQESPAGNILFASSNPTVVPIAVIQDKFDEFMDGFYIPCFVNSTLAFADPEATLSDLCMFGTPYFYGGNVQYASDGMDAYPSHRRNGAFHFNILQGKNREQFKRLIWGVPGDSETFAADDFPGLFCHNHLYHTTSPKKSNWLTDCGEEEFGGSGTPLGDNDCMSLQEASFGTANLRRLEKIHADIDPMQLFKTSDGPGYASSDGDSNGGGDSSDGGDSSRASALVLVEPALLLLMISLPTLLLM